MINLLCVCFSFSSLRPFRPLRPIWKYRFLRPRSWIRSDTALLIGSADLRLVQVLRDKYRVTAWNVSRKGRNCHTVCASPNSRFLHIRVTFIAVTRYALFCNNNNLSIIAFSHLKYLHRLVLDSNNISIISPFAFKVQIEWFPMTWLIYLCYI